MTQSVVWLSRWAVLLGLLGHGSVAKQSLGERFTRGEAWHIRITEALLIPLDYHGRYDRRNRKNVVGTLLNLS